MHEGPGTEIIGHRAGSGHAPGNTVDTILASQRHHVQSLNRGQPVRDEPVAGGRPEKSI